MLKTLQNFYKATTSRAWAIGTGNRYVSTLPTPSAGYLVISPSDTTKREIIAYSGTGTDSNGSYVTVTTRGVGGTTEQAHSKNEPVRMNIIAQHYSEVQDEVTDLQGQIDTLVLQNAPNASTTTRGIVLMATAPAEAGTAIVVGTNDPRLTPPTGQPSAFVAASSGAVNAGSGVVLNASGLVDETMIPFDYVKTVSKTFGVTTRDANIVGTQTIAHGLGKTPSLIRITAKYIAQDEHGDLADIQDSVGIYDGTNVACIYSTSTGSSSTVSGNSTTYIIYGRSYDGSERTSTATPTMDATNITLTWAVSGAATGAFPTYQILWEAEVFNT